MATIVGAKEVGEVVPGGEFHVMVTNVINLLVKLSKHEKLVRLTERPKLRINNVYNEDSVKKEDKGESLYATSAIKARSLKKTLQRNMPK